MTEMRVILASDIGVDDELLIPVGYAPMKELPTPGDVVCAPVPWRAKWRVTRVTEGDGFDEFAYVDFDPDETSYCWYDAEVVVVSQTDLDTSGARHVTLGRFPPSSHEARSGHVWRF